MLAHLKAPLPYAEDIFLGFSLDPVAASSHQSVAAISYSKSRTVAVEDFSYPDKSCEV
jgi:hypothetical protein